jgi:hypothetical protein
LCTKSSYLRPAYVQLIRDSVTCCSFHLVKFLDLKVFGFININAHITFFYHLDMYPDSLRFVVLIVLSLMIAILWDVKLCSPVEVYGCFGEPYCLYF